MSRPWLMTPYLACLVLVMYVSCAGAAVQETSDINISADVYRDCSDLPSDMPSGVYTLRPGEEPLDLDVNAFCDMDNDGGGWTVVIRRYDAEVQENFYRDWNSYKYGFGNLSDQFYWGNEHMWMLTSHPDRRYQVHFWLEDWEGETRHALYQDFEIASETDNYRLDVGAYSGDAGDSFQYNDNYEFSTYDNDNDDGDGNCAVDQKAGWWFWWCTRVQLTGEYYEGGYSGGNGNGITWLDWKGSDPYSLKAAVMKLKPA